jgi:hypothetical protein
MRHLLRIPHTETPVVAVVVWLTISLCHRQPLLSRCHQTPNTHVILLVSHDVLHRAGSILG